MKPELTVTIVPGWVSKIADEQVKEVEAGCPVSVAIERAVMQALTGAVEAQGVQALYESITEAVRLSHRADESAYEAQLGRGLDAMELVNFPLSSLTKRLLAIQGQIKRALPYDVVNEEG